MELTVDFSFSAAHRLPRYPGPCSRVHGHNYVLRVTLEGEPDRASGMVRDFEEIRAVVAERILAAVDHRSLNEHLENPTAEAVVVWCWERLEGALVGLRELRLWENPSYCVAYRGPVPR
jgi:6-pyruvoyltetrahydropterin/6-carboxytetrahydropterin synthase